MISGISVSNLGHAHPAIKQAIAEQMEAHSHLLVYGELIQKPQVNLAEALTKLLPSGLDNVFFVNSGSEAIEGAVKLARRHTGRKEVISCFNAYHGSTLGGLSLMGNAEYSRAFGPLIPHFKQIWFNHLPDLKKITRRTACVVVEPVQGEAGVMQADKAYWQQLRVKCKQTGALLVFDEVQSGMGRTGSLFAFEQLDVQPDVLVLAKALGGGLPLGAFIASRHIMQSLTTNPPLGHITTFGGHPLSCAASLSALQVLISSGIIHSVKQKAATIQQRLSTSLRVREVRAAGLLMAVQLDSFEQVKQVIHTCIEKGLITDWFLHNNTSLRLAPPLIITHEEIEWACQVLLQAIEQSSES